MHRRSGKGARLVDVEGDNPAATVAGSAAAGWHHRRELVLAGPLERGICAAAWGRLLLPTVHSADQTAGTVEAFVDALGLIRPPEIQAGAI
ncbi:hypothetical protein [Planobispora longispora]|uniref:hypothetical protein n=1 Tax=Planobispora longispora TaxID=28887 RepID=UPI0019419158|nr:hypothetical protein [Planobispora longispora]